MSTVISAQPSGAWHATVCEDLGVSTRAPTGYLCWWALMPSAVLNDHEDQAMYVKTRSVHNKNFFDDVRNELGSILQGLRVMMISEDDNATRQNFHPDALTSTQRSVLQALHIAKGFLGHREQHQAVTLFHLCTEVSDHLIAQMVPATQLFWQVLSRLCLGDAYAKFLKLDEAQSILQEAINLCEHPDVQPAEEQPADAGVQVLKGACHKVMCRIYLEAALGCENDVEERLADAVAQISLAVQLLETYFPKVLDYAEKRAEAAASLATAYSSRGVCDVRLGKFEECYQWFTKAQDVLQEFNLPHSNAQRILSQVAEQLEHAKQLHKFA